MTIMNVCLPGEWLSFPWKALSQIVNCNISQQNFFSKPVWSQSKLTQYIHAESWQLSIIIILFSRINKYQDIVFRSSGITKPLCYHHVILNCDPFINDIYPIRYNEPNFKKPDPYLSRHQELRRFVKANSKIYIHLKKIFSTFLINL